MTRERIHGVFGLIARFAAGVLAVFLMGSTLTTAPKSFGVLIWFYPLGILAAAMFLASVAGCASGSVSQLSLAAGLAGVFSVTPLILVPIRVLRTLGGGTPLLCLVVLLGCAITIALSIEVARLCGDIEELRAQPRFRWQAPAEPEVRRAELQDAQPQDAPDF